jgi:predicted RNA methylase
MGQRHSGRERRKNDGYDTPPWVIQEMIRAKHIPKRARRIWEPAAGRGNLGLELLSRGYDVVMSDIEPRGPGIIERNFFDVMDPAELGLNVDGILTNPPYGAQGPKFVEQALKLTERNQGWVMMLLSSEWDTASQRPHLIDRCPQYVGKAIHQERIVWFEPSDRPIAQKASGKQIDLEELLGPNAPDNKPVARAQYRKSLPSKNHAWFIWDWRTRNGWQPRTWWIPKRKETKVDLRTKAGREEAERREAAE